jgi:hypothetical protein
MEKLRTLAYRVGIDVHGLKMTSDIEKSIIIIQMILLFSEYKETAGYLKVKNLLLEI